MKIKAIALLAGWAALLLGGCATIQTRAYNEGAADNQGIAYHLPTGRYILSVVDSEGVITVSLGATKAVADTQARLLTRIPASGFSNNNVKITTNDARFIATADATSTGRLGEILAAAAESAGALLQASLTPSGATLYSNEVTLDQLPAAVAEANRVLEQHYRANCSDYPAATALPFSAELAAAGYEEKSANEGRVQHFLRCRQWALAGINGTPGNGYIAVDTFGQSNRSTPITEHPVYPNCARGICYRLMRTVRLQLTLGGRRSVTETFLAPDETSLAFIPFNNGVFAEQRYSLVFVDGYPTTYVADLNNELEGLVSVPGRILGGIAAGIVGGFQRERSVQQAQQEAVNQTRTNLEAQQQLAEFCDTNRGSCPGSAFRIMSLQANPEEDGGQNTRPVITDNGGDAEPEVGGSGPPIGPG